MGLFDNKDVRCVILVYAAAAMMIFLYGKIDKSTPIFSTSPDIQSYKSMAEASPHLTTAAPKPYVYRLLGPYTVGLLPFDVMDAFNYCAIVAFLAVVGIFYAFLRHSGINPSYAALTTILYIFNRSLAGFAVWEFFRIDDLLSFIEIIGLLWVMQERRWLAFATVLAIGAATRETPMLMIPVAFFFMLERHTLKDDLLKYATAVVPAIVIFLLLHAVVPATVGFNPAESFTHSISKVMLPETWYRLLINAWVPFAFLPVIFFGRTKAFFKGKKYAVIFIVLVLASAFFGGDNERLVAPAFVVVYFLYGKIFQELSLSRLAFAIIAICAFLTTFNHLFARYPIPRSATIIISASATVIVSVYFVWLKKRSERIVPLH